MFYLQNDCFFLLNKYFEDHSINPIHQELKSMKNKFYETFTCLQFVLMT